MSYRFGEVTDATFSFHDLFALGYSRREWRGDVYCRNKKGQDCCCMAKAITDQRLWFMAAAAAKSNNDDEPNFPEDDAKRKATVSTTDLGSAWPRYLDYIRKSQAKAAAEVMRNKARQFRWQLGEIERATLNDRVKQAIYAIRDGDIPPDRFEEFTGVLLSFLGC